MPYEAPTVDQFRERFPEFADVSEDAIDLALVDANRQVDETWLEDDYQTAIMELAAHLASVNQAGSDSFGQDDLRSITIGPLSISYGGKLSAADLTTSVYGQKFAALRRKNIPAIRVI